MEKSRRHELHRSLSFRSCALTSIFRPRIGRESTAARDQETTSSLWNFNGLNGRCSEVYECLKMLWDCKKLQETANNRDCGIGFQVERHTPYVILKSVDRTRSCTALHLHCNALQSTAETAIANRPSCTLGRRGRCAVSVVGCHQARCSRGSLEMCRPKSRRPHAGRRRLLRSVMSFAEPRRRRLGGIDVGFEENRDGRLIAESGCPRSGFSTVTQKSLSQRGMGEKCARSGYSSVTRKSKARKAVTLCRLTRRTHLNFRRDTDGTESRSLATDWH
jgi:hypothetical protein